MGAAWPLAAQAAQPGYLAGATAPVMGWWHPARQPCGLPPVVMCPALGDEAIGAHRGWRDLAHLLSEAGVPVLRLDLPGEGDSFDPPEQGDRWTHWRAAVHSAIEAVKAREGSRAGSTDRPAPGGPAGGGRGRRAQRHCRARPAGAAEGWPVLPEGVALAGWRGRASEPGGGRDSGRRLCRRRRDRAPGWRPAVAFRERRATAAAAGARRPAAVGGGPGGAGGVVVGSGPAVPRRFGATDGHRPCRALADRSSTAAAGLVPGRARGSRRAIGRRGADGLVRDRQRCRRPRISRRLCAGALGRGKLAAVDRRRRRQAGGGRPAAVQWRRPPHRSASPVGALGARTGSPGRPGAAHRSGRHW